MKKLNSYQKQKIRIKELERDIYNLVEKSDSEDGILTNLKYRIIYESERLLMSGTSEIGTQGFRGFTSNDISLK